jgi:hypothetical protein
MATSASGVLTNGIIAVPDTSQAEWPMALKVA